MNGIEWNETKNAYCAQKALLSILILHTTHFEWIFNKMFFFYAKKCLNPALEIILKVPRRSTDQHIAEWL
jgi:hypothetical protein